MRHSALGGVLLVVATGGGASAAPRLAGIPASVAHAPAIATQGASLTTVTLKQSRTLIDWSSFNINSGEQVDFLFQNNSGIVLNRVGGVANIDGKLMGCIVTCGSSGRIGGNVWFYSSTGVIFGPHAEVSVGGLLATTSPLLSEKAFLDGSQLGFGFGGGLAGAGIVVRSGARLNAQGALALISPTVTTEAGAKVTAGGTALYGAAQNYTIHFDESAGNGLNLLDFEVPASALSDGSLSATPLNLAGDTAAGKVMIASVSRPGLMSAVISLGGTVTANGAADGGGGDILLTASGAPTRVDVAGALRASRGVSIQAPDGGAITVIGAISAVSASGAGGALRIGGAGTGSVTLASTGRLDASGTGGQAGGKVVLTGAAVSVDGAVAATGGASGGMILVGGGDHGQDASVANAATTDIGAGAVLDASAASNGAGGHVVVWSQQSTRFQGSILGRGGAGGSAEVSSAGYLAYAGATDLRGAGGSVGRLLLDPSELTVTPTGGSGTVSGGVNPPVSAAASTIGADTIDTALLSADVTISTHQSVSGGDGVIEFNGGAGPLMFANTGSTGRTLTFAPEQGFLFDTDLVTKGPLNLTLNAGSAPINLPSGKAITAPDGALTLIGSSLLLGGDIAAQQTSLTASGSIGASGAITTGDLTGSSGAQASFTGANSVGSLKNFTAGAGLTLSNTRNFEADNVTAGTGDLDLTTTSGTLTVNGVSAGAGVNLTAANNLYLIGGVTGASAAFSAGGAIDQVGGTLTAGALSAAAVNGISLTMTTNAVTGLGALTNTGSGGIAFVSTPGFTLAGDVNAPGQSVRLFTLNGDISQNSGAITANFLTVAAAGNVSLTGANTVSVLGGLAGANVDFVDTGSFTLAGNVSAPGQTASLVSTGGSITQASGVITASNFSASAASGLSLGDANEIATATALSTGSGGMTFTDNQTVAISSLAVGGGNISIDVTAGDLNLNSVVNAPGSVTLTAANAINAVSLNVAGDYSLTAAAINDMALLANLTGSASNLNIDFTSTLGSTDLTRFTLSAPGSVTITAHDSALYIGSINAGANVTLSTTGTLSEGEGGGISAASLTASAVNGVELGASNAIASVTSLTNTSSGSINFNNNESVTIGSINQGGSGSISLRTYTGDLTLTTGLTSPAYVDVSAAGNLTVDGITAPNDITLYAGGVLTETAGASLTTGGNYNATAMTMNAAAMQPVFTASSYYYAGNLNLTFIQTGGLTDLTGIALSAPQAVSVSADQDLKIGSITAGANVTLNTSGILSTAAGATVNLTGTTYYDNYSVTAASIDVTNPSVLQPIFAPSFSGDLQINLTQTGAALNLTGAPLSAPGFIAVNANGANTSLTLDSMTAGGSVSASAGGALSVSSISTPSSITLNAGTVLSAAPGATINLLGNYSATAQTIDPTNPMVLQPTFMTGSSGSLSLTFTQSGATTDISATPLSAPGSVSVLLASSDSNENLTVGSITAGVGVSLYTGSYVTNGGNLTSGVINAGGSVSFSTGYYFYSTGGSVLAGDIMAGGNVTASTGAYSTSAFSFGAITSSSGQVNLSTGVYYGGALTTGAVSAGGPVFLSTGAYSSGALTVGPITSGSNVGLSAGSNSTGVMTVNSIVAGGYVALDAGGALQAAVTSGPPVSVTTGGTYSATGSTIDPLLFQPTFTGSFGDLNLTFTGSGGVDMTGHPLTAPGSISVSANNENLTVDLLTAANDITLFAGGALASADVVSPTLGGSYSATGSTIDTLLFQPTFTSGSIGNLSLTFNGAGGADLTGIPLTAPGQVSLSAPIGNLIVDSITAGSDVSLSAGSLQAAASGSPVVIQVGGSYSATASTIDPALFQPTFTNAFGDLSLTFTGSSGVVDLTGHPLTAPGSVSVTSYYENLTVDSITAGGDISLTANNSNVSVAPMGLLNLSGSYNVSASTIDPTALHPLFAPSTFGDFNITYYGSGGADLTGTPLFAPGSVSIYAPNENLTVDSITAGFGVSLRSGGALLAAASGSPVTITLGGDYSAEGVTIDPTLYQPTYTIGSRGSLSLTFDQSGGSIDLTGHPLNAPGSVTVLATGNAENLTVDTISAGANVFLSDTLYYNTGTLTAGAITAGGGVTLSTGSYYGGAITAGTITAGDGVSITTGYYESAPLTVGSISAGGDVSLSSGGYYGGALTASSISAGGQVTATSGYYSGGAVTVGPIMAGSSVSLSAGMYSGGVLTVDSITANGSVTLNAGGALQAASPGVTITLGGSYSASGVTIDPVLYQPIFEAESSGNLSLDFLQTGAAVDLTGHPLVAPGSISVTASEDLTIDSLTAASQVSLSASGALNEGSGAVITGTGLSASATNGIVLNGANNVQVVYGLSNSSTGGISFTNEGNIVLNGYYNPVSASGQTVNLVSLTGSISDSYYYYYYYPSITAGTFTASAVTGINLSRYNQITNLGPISNSTSGGINFNNYYSYTLVGDVSAPGQTVNLTTVYGGISQTSGVITAASLTASAVTGLAFNDANAVASLGMLTNSYSGGISFTNGGDLVLSGNLVTAGQQTVNVASDTGSVTESGGVIFADTLTGSAATGLTLNSTNEVVHLGAILNTGSGGISFTNDGDLMLTGNISANGQAVNLVSQNGALTQGLGSITAGTLNLSAITGISLGASNFATQLGTVSTGSGGVYFVNDGGFDVAGALTARGQSVTLMSNSGFMSESTGVITANSLTAIATSGLRLSGANQVANLGLLANGAHGGIVYTSAGNVALTIDLNGFGEVVALAAQSGSVTQSAGQVLTAGVLSVSATTGVTLGGANAITHLGPVNSGAGDVNLNDTVSLSILGALQAAGQSVNLTGATSITTLGGAITANTVSVTATDGISLQNVSGALGSLVNTTKGGIDLSNGSDLKLTADVNAPGQIVSLNSDNGAISQTGGVITAGLISTSSITGVSLGGANQIGAIGILNNTGSGGIALTSVGDLAIDQVVVAPGQTVSLTSTSGAVTETGGVIAASTLNASAATGVTLTGGNLVTNLGVLSNTISGGISYLSAGDPNLTGNISAPGQTVSLVSSTGSFNQTAGIITADTLNVSAATGIALNDANMVAKLGAVDNSGSGGISFTNAGDLALTGSVQAQGQAIMLVSTGGSISQPSGFVGAQDLAFTASGGVNLSNATADNQATITATTFTLTPQVDSNNALQAPTLIIESRSGLIDLGDNLTDPGFAGMTIAGVTLTALNTDSISFYAGYFNATNRQADLAPQAAVAIKVGDIHTGFDGFDGIPGGATAFLYAGPNSGVSVIGSITSKNPGLGHIVIGDRTADTWTPKSINITGSIGASGTQLAPLNSVELNATDSIVMGDSQFQQAIATAVQSGRTSSINIDSGFPAGVTQSGTGAIFIGANTLTLRSQGVIVSQNTGMAGQDTGITLGNGNMADTVLTLGSTGTAKAAAPKIIDIFGTLTDATGVTLLGMDVDPSTAVVLEQPLSIGNIYRANGCVIGEVAMCKIMSGLDTTTIKLIQGVQAADIAKTTAQPTIIPTYATSILIATQVAAPVGDPTITGVGSEEIWRAPSCDSKGATSCR